MGHTRAKKRPTKGPKPVAYEKPGEEPPKDEPKSQGIGLSLALRHLSKRLTNGEMANEELANSIKFCKKVLADAKSSNSEKINAANLVARINADLDRAAGDLIRAEVQATMGQGGSDEQGGEGGSTVVIVGSQKLAARVAEVAGGNLRPV